MLLSIFNTFLLVFMSVAGVLLVISLVAIYNDLTKGNVGTKIKKEISPDIDFNEQILEISRTSHLLATKLVKDKKNLGMKESMKYVDDLIIASKNNTSKKNKLIESQSIVFNDVFSFNENSYTSSNQANKFGNLDLLWIEYDVIPENKPGSQTIVFEFDDSYNLKSHIEVNTFDPSTIFTQMPISSVVEGQYVEPLQYWPSYYEMNPNQKYLFLVWLKNTSEEIDMGYVFTYYYGLERHLLFGNQQRAFEEIVKLRRVFKNKSFQEYSKNALLFSCFINKDIAPLMSLSFEDRIEDFTSLQLLITYFAKIDLSPENLVYIMSNLEPKAKAAIKKDKILFIKCVEYILCLENGNPIFQFSQKWDIKRAGKTTFTAFCNYTFPKNVRYIQLPDFYKHKAFTQEVLRVFTLSYQEFKSKNRFSSKLLLKPNIENL